MASLAAVTVALVACHGGEADHFASFAQKLKEQGYQVSICASGEARKKFEARKIEVAHSFNADNLSEAEREELAVEIAKICSTSSVVLTGVGHIFEKNLQRALKVEAPEVLRLAYYDNPEPYVPGGYSETAAEVMCAAQRVLFANANLIHAKLEQQPNIAINLPIENRRGIGYYPVHRADELAEKRKVSQKSLRATWFAEQKLEDKGQKVLVYFGGNNTVYFKEAFPAFVKVLAQAVGEADLSPFIIVLQQHPDVKRIEDKQQQADRQMMESWIKEQAGKGGVPKVIISDQTTEVLQGFADGALVYQTSMGPLLAIAGFPIVQVGHQTFEDILIKGQLATSATNSQDFVRSIRGMLPQEISQEKRQEILKKLGIRETWPKELMEAFSVS